MRHAIKILMLGCVAVSPLAVGCDPAFVDRLERNFRGQLDQIELEDVCGPGDFGVLISDCPVEGVCFSTACEAHNFCYGTCGVDKFDCDEAFFHDMVALCSSQIPLTDNRFTYCRYVALTYYLAVSQNGQRAFELTQEEQCGPPIDGPDEVLGACCIAGQPPVCISEVPDIACTPRDVFLPELSCTEIEELFGGCPAPAHDACKDRADVCTALMPDPDLGQCSGEIEAHRGQGVCSVSQQDCANGRACLAIDGTAYRCTVPTDNRLATTDGPLAAGDCLPSGEIAFQADVWYELVAPCNGKLTIRMCAEATYDAMLAVYGPNDANAACTCPTDNTDLLACNDDFCGFAGTTAGLSVDNVVEGGCYVIRVGGWSNLGTAADAQRGVSELDIGFFCAEAADE